MTDESWRRLARFESNDLVQSAYKKRHNRELNATRTRDVVSTFIQAREYFSNASRADVSIKPLLLYYGVLALSRGLILMCSPKKYAESLKPSHGLDAVGWNSTLANRPADAIGDMVVKIQQGTMTELFQPTANRAYYCHMSSAINWGITYPEVPDGAQLRFEDIMLGMVDLNDEYRLWRDKRIPSELVMSILSQDDGTLIELPVPSGGIVNASWDSFMACYPGSKLIHKSDGRKTWLKLAPNVLPYIVQSGGENPRHSQHTHRTTHSG